MRISAYTIIAFSGKEWFFVGETLFPSRAAADEACAAVRLNTPSATVVCLSAVRDGGEFRAAFFRDTHKNRLDWVACLQTESGEEWVQAQRRNGKGYRELVCWFVQDLTGEPNPCGKFADMCKRKLNALRNPAALPPIENRLKEAARLYYGKQEFRNAEAKAAFAGGQRQWAIAKECGVDQSQVSRWLARLKEAEQNILAEQAAAKAALVKATDPDTKAEAEVRLANATAKAEKHFADRRRPRKKAPE